MGQKVNPNGLRLGINREWNSTWYSSKKDFSKYLKQDIEIRKYLESVLENNSKKKAKVEIAKADDKKVEKKGSMDARISSISISRIVNSKILITIKCQYVGVVLGQDGANIKKIENELAKRIGVKKEEIHIDVVEVVNPDLDAVLVCKDIARQIEQRASFRIVQKKAIQRVLKAGAKGCKTMTKGRVGGAEIARYEEYREGVLSLHTLRQPIDYAHVDAHTTYGVIGCKVWIALPDNYKELRSKKSEGFKGDRKFRDSKNGKNFRKDFKNSNAPLPNPNKDNEAKKGE